MRYSRWAIRSWRWWRPRSRTPPQAGTSSDEACELLARDPILIASFSRALLEGLTESQTDEEFNAQLEASIEQIYQASVDKQPLSR